MSFGFGRARPVLAGFGCVALLAIASPAPHHNLGEPFAVNVVGGQVAFPVSVAREPDGDFVVAWYRERDASFSGVDSWVRRFDATGLPLSDDIKVNTTTEQWEGWPQVAVSPRGDFVVVWYSEGAPNDTVPYGIQAQRFDSSGQPVGSQFEVSTTPTPASLPRYIDQASVAMAPDGRFVVVWREGTGVFQTTGIYARRYDANGQALDLPFFVGQTGADAKPDVDMDATGGFVAVWSYFDNNGGQDIYARRYDSAGQALDVAFKVNTDVDGDVDAQNPHTLPGVAVDADGDFAIVWSRIADLQTNARDAYLRIYAADGQPRSGALKLNEANTGHGIGLDLDAEGYGVVSWHLTDQAVLGVRHFDVTGAVSDASFVGSSVVDLPWGGGGVGLDADGDVVHVWRSGMIMAQRMSGRRELDMAVAVQGSASQVATGAAYSYLVQVDNVEPAVTPTGVAALDAAFGMATGVAVDLYFPDGAVFQSFDAPGWTCTQDGVAGHCSLDGKLPAQASSSITVHLTAPAQDGYAVFSATVDADQFDATDTVNNAGSVTTTVGAPPPQDSTPDSFSFAPQEASRGATVTSNTVTITGINVPAAIGVSGGSYSIGCTGTFTTAAGTIRNGQAVCVRHVASSQFSTAVTTTLTIGGVPGTFTSTTVAADTTPDAYSFTNQDGVEPLAEVTSEPITVTGIEDATAISVAGGQYSINAGAFTDAAGSVLPGDSVRVRHVAAMAFETPMETTLDIGGVSGAFVSTTRAGDATPEAYDFADQSGVEPGSVVTSEALVLTGFEVAVAVSVSGGEYSVNEAPFTSASGNVSPGDSIRVRHTASGEFSTATQTELTVGGISGVFVSTTRGGDVTPDPYAFIDQQGVEPGAVVTSAAVVLTGFDVAVPASVAGGEYSINGGPFTSAAGSAAPGDSIRVRHTASVLHSSSTDTVLTVGGVSDAFVSTTRAVPRAAVSDNGGAFGPGLLALLLGIGVVRRRKR